jgi:hypothetical protein
MAATVLSVPARGNFKNTLHRGRFNYNTVSKPYFGNYHILIVQKARLAGKPTRQFVVFWAKPYYFMASRARSSNS